MVDRRVNLLRQSGIEFSTNVDVGKDISVKKLQQDFDALIFTIGSTNARDLPVDNRSAIGVHLAMEYLTKNTKNALKTPKKRPKTANFAKNR